MSLQGSAGRVRLCNPLFIAATFAALAGCVIVAAYPAEPPGEAAPQIVCKLDLSRLEPREPVDPKQPVEKVPPGYRTQTEIVQAALKDAEGLPSDIRVDTHYLSLGHIPFADRAELLRVLSYAVNEISRNFELIPPRIVLPDGSLVAVVSTDYGWKIFGRLARIDPYWHIQAKVKKGKGSAAKEELLVSHAPWLPQKEINGLSVLVESQAPIVSADWFMVQTGRVLGLNGKDNGTGYADFLGIAKRDDFEKLIKFNKKDSQDIGRDQRAALERSGVSINGRQIEIFRALTGTFYRTLDTDDPTGKGNPINNLKEGEYQHKAEELIAMLPNGLPAWHANSDQGVQQPTVPDFVGSDDSTLQQGKDHRIHLGPLSCGNCHMSGANQVLRPIDDWVRRTIRPPLALQALERKEFEIFRRQYFTVLDTQIGSDRSLFSAKVLEACGMATADLQKAYSKAWYRYALGEYGTKEIAPMMGVTEEALIEAMKGYNTKHGFLPLPVLGGLLAEPEQKMRVEALEEAFSALQSLIADYRK